MNVKTAEVDQTKLQMTRTNRNLNALDFLLLSANSIRCYTHFLRTSLRPFESHTRLDFQQTSKQLPKRSLDFDSTSKKKLSEYGIEMTPMNDIEIRQRLGNFYYSNYTTRGHFECRLKIIQLLDRTGKR